MVMKYPKFRGNEFEEYSSWTAWLWKALWSFKMLTKWHIVISQKSWFLKICLT